VAIRPREVITPRPVIDLMAALKRSLAQDMPTPGAMARQKRAKLPANRCQPSLLLPVAGGRSKKEKPAAVAMRPRKKP
jgi:hypothetical protein